MDGKIDPLHAAESILIPHTAFANGVSLIQKAVKLSDGISRPKYIAVLGPSGSGKTRLLDTCAAEYESYRDQDGLNIPILQINVPSKPTVKALSSEILRALGASDFDKGTEIQQTQRAKELIKQCNVMAIFLDDFHHFVDQTSNNVMHYAADWLKLFIDEVRRATVITGLPYAAQVMNINEQLARRFMAPIRLNRFRWQIEAERQEFVEILAAFYAGLQPYFSLPKLHSKDLPFRFYCASGGLIGYVVNILECATETAALEDRSKLSLDDIDASYMEAVWRKEDPVLPESPFSWCRLPKITTELLAGVQTLGEPSMPESRKRRSGLKPGENKLSSVLTR
jgi:hypothetical protein